MKSTYRDVLKRIYKSNSVHALDVISSIERSHGDHRDFYPLVALINSGHIGYTGAAPDPSVDFADTMLTHTFQCYSQGPGRQHYKTATVIRGAESEDVYFFIGPKGIEYFETKRSDNKKILISAGFSLLAGVTVAVISFLLKQSTQ
ncbi:hypothetical protein PMI21_05520 [Pseudomonas sp. GM18]|uniref:hypothetical protein n=1 Tax=Pseudomonas sp. GM18 TaxID=1144324 RepID=UPI00027249E4|nr:hypothetical protein [Pseudomonas sp. GM18]EJM09788.1 hypothetical protein PMI21_05520 [Pseudomonas sp. GM18]